MRSNFVPHDYLRGEGTCRVCDYPYSLFLDKEVEEHRRHHRRYLSARREGWAPASAAIRKERRESGLRAQGDLSVTLEIRLKGAQLWLSGYYDEYVAQVLRRGGRPTDIQEFFAKYVAGKRGFADLAVDVVDELRARYSGSPTPACSA